MNYKVGDLRVRSFIHPDSLNQRVWEVERLTEATGKYAAEGETYWESLTLEPFASEKDAEDFIENLYTY